MKYLFLIILSLIFSFNEAKAETFPKGNCPPCNPNQPLTPLKSTDAIFKLYSNDIKNTVSSYNYNLNNNGYLGVYQMGKAALVVAGMIENDKKISNKSRFIWTQKAKSLGVNTIGDFLRNRKAQDEAFLMYTNKQIEFMKELNFHKYLCSKITLNTTTGAIDLIGLLKANYFFGTIELDKAFQSKNYNIIDANKNTIAYYLLDGSAIKNHCIPRQSSINFSGRSSIK